MPPFFVILHHEKIRRCHSSITYCQPIHLFPSSGDGRDGTDWLSGGLVPFGKKKFYTAIVTNVHYAAYGGEYETKDIAGVLDSSPVLLPKQYEFWRSSWRNIIFVH